VNNTGARSLKPLDLKDVEIGGEFWAPRQRTNRQVTLSIEYQQLVDTGRIKALELKWKPGDPDMPHHFWDSDIAKWIEAAAYSLATHNDPELARLVDETVDLLAAGQQADGYLNTHYTSVEPENRWKNLRDMHELYCAGHLMEAAVAYYEATGKRKLLDVMSRYADYIGQVFGPEPGQRRGYPGHEEIELALIKLYRATSEQRYLNLAAFFVRERGQRPHYFDLEAKERGEGDDGYWARGHDYTQSQLPIVEQQTLEGHSVRATYLMAGVTDVAAEKGDAALMAAAERLWDNATERRMYVTGGIGSSAHGERFSYDYDLRNDIAYTETCAAIGLVFWAQRMMLATADARYADVMERALYNGGLSGISLDGRCFFYANPLEVIPADHDHRPDLYRRPAQSAERQEWFGCACCPPNIARVIASLGAYAYSTAERKDGAPPVVYCHLYVGGTAHAAMGGTTVAFAQETRYPWDGHVGIRVGVKSKAAGAGIFGIALRIPGWCRQATIAVNGEPMALADVVDKGYAHVVRQWQDGDLISLNLEMPVVRVQANPRVRADVGRVALMRGPIVYCLEQADNGKNLNGISLADSASLHSAWEPDLLGGVVTIETTGRRERQADWGETLYRPLDDSDALCSLTFVPYYAWANRTPGEMLVWVRRA